MVLVARPLAGPPNLLHGPQSSTPRRACPRASRTGPAELRCQPEWEGARVSTIQATLPGEGIKRRSRQPSAARRVHRVEQSRRERGVRTSIVNVMSGRVTDDLRRRVGLVDRPQTPASPSTPRCGQDSSIPATSGHQRARTSARSTRASRSNGWPGPDGREPWPSTGRVRR